MKEIIKSYFSNESIVGDQIESVNNFVATRDNPESIMQRIVDETKVTDDDRPGMISLDRSKTGGRKIEIYFGRSKDKGRFIGNSTIWIDTPEIKEASGATSQITPEESRIRDLNYMAPINLMLRVVEDGVESSPETIKIGDMPVMVRSKICTLYGSNLDKYIEKNGGPINSSRIEKLRYVGEDPDDTGGYFIIGGSERVIVSLEDLAPNKILVEYEEKYDVRTEVAKVFSQTGGYRAMTSLEKSRDGDINVTIPTVSGSIPIVILMKALGMSKDNEIHDAIFSYREMDPIIYYNIELTRDTTKTNMPNGVITKVDAITYLEKRFAAGQAKEFRDKKISQILDKLLLPHLGDSEEDRIKKALYLGRMARSLLELNLGKRKVDDKDHLSNKRVKLAGDLMDELFRNAFQAVMKDLKYQLEKTYNKKKGIRIKPAVRQDLLTQKIIHAMATGNWIGGRTGVSQLLDRVSNVSTISHLRRIISPLTRSQPHFEARDLHPTQWGRICPNETPDGQNCGLVKNEALMINISKGVDTIDVMDFLFMNGMKEPRGEERSQGRFYLNGDFVGYHPDPQDIVNKVRDARRGGKLSDEINIRFDAASNEVIINCDRGRIRRPLLTVVNGNTLVTRDILEKVRLNEISFRELTKYGVMEWIDAEEEEDIYVALYAFGYPERCPHCNAVFYRGIVDWINVGESNMSVACRRCGKEFPGTNLLSKEHTHLEIDPSMILGVTASMIPYPEHNSSPRITMASAMTKQSLGMSSTNFRIRTDTRGHFMHYPQVPLVKTQVMDYVKYDKRPAGQNFVVAIVSYHGYNIHDAIVFNKGAIERGIGRSNFFRTYKAVY
ncbi:MAG: DNA-directed RNA polymerase subunit B'', partial [Candidatus Thermoplasmatota archaeon]|nr:DNA-directed RNA polymerase subunit B'' [Candidatus Thermoplasmatota archaeon]